MSDIWVIEHMGGCGKKTNHGFTLYKHEPTAITSVASCKDPACRVRKATLVVGEIIVTAREQRKTLGFKEYDKNGRI